MSFNINLLKTAINAQGGIAEANKFYMHISRPAAFGLFTWPPHLALFCEISELPGRQMLSTPQVIYGSQRKMPYGAIYNDLQASFICTESMIERRCFDAWQSAIQDPTNNYMNYYDQYVTDIHIFKLNADGIPTYGIRCEEAYPVTIETQQLNWGNTNDYLKLNVQFSYLKWKNYDDVFFGSGAGFSQDGAITMPGDAPLPEGFGSAFDLDRPSGVLTENNKLNIIKPS